MHPQEVGVPQSEVINFENDRVSVTVRLRKTKFGIRTVKALAESK